MDKLIKQAFTLIELLVVIAIIGILSGLIVVAMGGTTQKATIAKAQVFSNSLRNSLMLNLVSEWKFDGSGVVDGGAATTIYTQDTWSGGNNCTIGGAPTVLSGSNCISGSCLQFNSSTSDYLTCGTTSSFDFGDGTTDSPFTLSGWFKISEMTSRGLMSKCTAAASCQYYLWTSGSDRIHFQLFDSTSSVYIGRYYNTPITNYENQWTYLTAIYDGTEVATGIKIYLNGSRIDGSSESAGTYVAMEAMGINFNIGRYLSANYLSSLIDDVRVFNSVPSLSQIREHYYVGLNELMIKGEITKEDYQNRIEKLTTAER